MMVEPKKRSFKQFLAKNWKVIAFIIVISIFLNAQGCMCGQDANDKGDGTESTEDQLQNGMNLLTQLSATLCGVTGLADTGLCAGGGTTATNPTNICDTCAPGSEGDPCRQTCANVMAPQLKGTKLVKSATSFVYSYEMSMNVMNDTVYSAYFKESSGVKNNLQSCAGTASAGTVVRCAEANIESDKDNVDICVDVYSGGKSQTTCKPLTTSNVPTISFGTPTGGETVITGEYNVRQNAVFTLSIIATDPDCTDATGCFRYSYTSDPGVSTERFSISPVSGQIKFSPIQADIGTFTMTITVTDTDGNPSTLYLIIHVLDVNDAPVINIPAITMQEDTPYPINLKDYTTDADTEDITTWSAVSTDGTMTIVISQDGAATITPQANWNGATTIKFTVTDAGGLSSSQTVTVTVSPVSDAPYVSPPIPAISLKEGFEKTSRNIAEYKHDDDSSGSDLKWSVESFEASMITASIEGTDSFILESVPYANGNTIITLGLTDKAGNKATYDLPVSIGTVNNAPIIAELPDITMSTNTSDPRHIFVLDLNTYVEDPDDPKEDLRWAVHGVSPELIATYDPSTQSIKFEATPGHAGVSKMVELIVTDFGKATSTFVVINIVE